MPQFRQEGTFDGSPSTGPRLINSMNAIIDVSGLHQTFLNEFNSLNLHDLNGLLAEKCRFRREQEEFVCWIHELACLD